MSAINIAIRDILRKIPRRILERTFRVEHRFNRFSPNDIEQQILSKVIRPVVLTDCGLIAGVDALIDLTKTEREDLPDFSSVYRIPKSLTNGRSIVQALNIRFIQPNVNNNLSMGGLCGRSGILMGAKAIVDATADIPNISTHHVEVIGENMIRVFGSSYVPLSSFLHCVVEYDDNLQALSPRSYSVFAEACVLATKAYIYNTLDIELDEGEIIAGHSFGAIRRIIDGYSDAAEQYDEFRKMKLQKVLNMQEGHRMAELIQLMVGGYK